MKFYKEDYLTNLLGFSGEVKGINMSFKDEILEQKYEKHEEKEKMRKSRILCIFLSSSFIIQVLYSVYINNAIVINAYLLITMFVIELILAKLSFRCVQKCRVFHFLKYLRISFFYAISTYCLFFPEVEREPITNLKFAYVLMLEMNFIYFYLLDFNYIMLLIIPIFNILLFFSLKYLGHLGSITVYSDSIVLIINYLLVYFLKKKDHFNRKLIFFETYKNDNYFEYIKNLIDVLKNMVITVKKDGVLFVNDYTKNFLLNKFSLNSNDFIEENRKIDLKDNTLYVQNLISQEDLKHYIEVFFKSLIIETPDNNFITNCSSFLDILCDLFTQENFDTINFSRVGNFKIKNEFQSQFFEIYIRKLRFKEDIIEILIYDISQIKEAERINIESKYKQKILAKIAHEFKTPLITIISLIQKIIENCTEISLSTKNNLNHVSNLSNYVISLISDIIQYVSNSVDIRVQKADIYLKEVLEFVFNVLRTLVDCSEKKKEKIKTILDIEDNLHNFVINTDEHRLKQILLNLISNAFKFTISGEISLKAKLKNDSLVISVKDTGIGIRDEDKHLIFQENIQLNVDNEYNSKGSGLGLSITKNISNFLNIGIGFKSNYGKGSKFYISLNEFKFLEKKTKNTSSEQMTEIFHHNILSKNLLSLSMLLENHSDRNALSDRYRNDRSINLKIRNRNQLYMNEVDLVICFSLCVRNSEKDLIVVIDDHELVRHNTVNLLKIVLKNLRLFNFDFIEGSDGIELLNIVSKDREGKIKYIFSDENMDYLNGSDAVKIIRNLEQNHKIRRYPIVSITAFDDNDIKKRILDSGFDQVLSKPCNKSMLIEILTKFKQN